MGQDKADKGSVQSRLRDLESDRLKGRGFNSLEDDERGNEDDVNDGRKQDIKHPY
jgi:hypothetical protein